MIARINRYFRKLGFFQGAIAVLLLTQVISNYVTLWQLGLWWLCVGTIGTGLVVSLVLWHWLVNNES